MIKAQTAVKGRVGRREEGREGGGAFPGETGPQDVQQREWELTGDLFKTGL